MLSSAWSVINDQNLMILRIDVYLKDFSEDLDSIYLTRKSGPLHAFLSCSYVSCNCRRKPMVSFHKKFNLNQTADWRLRFLH